MLDTARMIYAMKLRDNKPLDVISGQALREEEDLKESGLQIEKSTLAKSVGREADETSYETGEYIDGNGEQICSSRSVACLSQPE